MLPQRNKKHDEIIVRFERERWRSPDSDFMIGIAHVVDGSIGENGNAQKLKGKIGILGEVPRGKMDIGLQYILHGRYRIDEQYGPQIAFDTFDLHRPTSRNGIIKYLCQCKGNLDVRGIGRATAEELYSVYGDGCIDALIDDPERVASEIKRFPVESAKLVSAHLKLIENTRHVKVELMGLVDGFGFPRSFIRWAIDRWGAEAVARLKQNPYRAGGARSVGFLKADAFYKHVGQERFGADSKQYRMWLSAIKRQAYAGWYEIASDTSGHVWYARSRFVKGIKDRISGTDVNESRAIELAKRAGVIRVRTDRSGMEWVAESRSADAEEYVANHIADAAEQSTVSWPTIDEILAADSMLTEHHQLPAIRSAMSGPIGLLTGSAGTGKTRCTAAIVRAIVKKHGPLSIAIASPTGKAAVVCTQAMLDVGLNIRARTIHSTLGVDTADDGAGWKFLHNEKNPLPFDFIIVDESSMVDVGLMASLLRARSRNCGIIFVGDDNQLAPVGRGSPLRDFIAANLPCGKLSEIHRNAGTIVQVCTAIRDGQPFDGVDKLAPDETPPQNLKFCRANKADAPGRVLDLVRAVQRQGVFDPVDDLQVLVAVNQRSPLGREALSLAIRDILNPHGEQPKGSRFRIGDKVVQRSNGFFKDAENRSADKPFVANGDIGRVKSIQKKTLVVEFKEPRRVVSMPIGADSGDSGGEKSGGDLQLAYCLTVHSSQGSQWPLTIVCIDEYPGATGRTGSICGREWFYTAFSRAQTACFAVGQLSIANSAAKMSHIRRRKTFLAERICENMDERNLSFSSGGESELLIDLFA